MMQAEMESDQLQQEVVQYQKQNREEAQAVMSMQRSKTTKITKKFTQR